MVDLRPLKSVPHGQCEAKRLR